MKIIYVSSLCTPEKFNSVFTDLKYAPGQQIQKYHTLLAEGFVANGADVETVSALQVTRKNYSGRYIKGASEIRNGVKYNYLPIINLPVIKRLVITVSAFFKTLALCKKDRDAVIIADVLNISVAAGARFALYFRKRKNVGIVTDLPDLLSQRGKKFSAKINNALMNSFRYYVFLTEKMSKVVKCRPGDYVVIEGQTDINMHNREIDVKDKYDKKICIYAGTLQKRFGMDYLIEGFAKACVENAELRIYGSGSYLDDVKEYCKKFPSIKYMGVKPNAEIVEEELKASLLVNPRHSTGEYTEYSFPSKNLEYMVSGTPVLTTELAGMPDEYKDYVFLIKDETSDGIAQDFRDILSQTPEELHAFGVRAKEFVLREKNNVIAAKKIMELTSNG